MTRSNAPFAHSKRRSPTDLTEINQSLANFSRAEGYTASMHELSLANSIIELIGQQSAQAGFKTVHVVRVTVGALSSVEPDALAFGFEAVALGTVAQGARLEILRVPARGYCTDCAVEIDIASRADACPRCGGYQWVVVTGEELTLNDLEVD